MDLWCSALGHSRQFKHRNNPKISKQIPQNHHQRTSNDTLHHDLNVPYVRDEIKKLSQRSEQHPNTSAIDLMTPKHHAGTINYNLCHWAYTLQDFHKLSNVSLNVTRSGKIRKEQARS